MPMHARTVPTSKTPAELWSMGEDEITVAIIKPDAVGMPWTEELPADAEAGEGEEPVDGGGDDDEEGGSNGGAPKVDVVAEDKAEAIVERARTEGFEVVRSMRLRMSKAQAQAFYEGRASEEETDFMSSGPVVVLLLRKEGAVAAWNELIGDTNPHVARERAMEKNPLAHLKWTIRAQMGTDPLRNAVHGSASLLNAAKETAFFFSEYEKLERTVVVLPPSTVATAKEGPITADLQARDFVVIGRSERKLTVSDIEGLLPASMAQEREALVSDDVPCVALALERANAVAGLRVAIGDKGVPGTIADVHGKGAVMFAPTAMAASALMTYWFPSPLESERTLALIKPQTADSDADAIKDEIRKNGFTILKESRAHLTKERAEQFYAEHRGRSFFNRLTNYMSSGPLVALVLTKPGAIKAWRTLMGPTNTLVARKDKPRSLRARFGIDGTRNATHGSDSQASAQREISFFFPALSGAASGPLLTGNDARDYLAKKKCTEEKTMNQVLVEALVQLCKNKPIGNDAVRWLGNYLVNNNPAKPTGSEIPSEVGKDSIQGENREAEETQAAPPAPHVPAAEVFPSGKSRSEYPNGGVAIPPARAESRSIVFVLGGPGSGKGTQCAKIVEEFGYTHLSSGDLLRAEVASGSERGQKFKSIMDGGGLVPLHDVMALLNDAMEDSGSNRFLLDGYPRALDQAFEFERIVGQCSFVIQFDASDESMKARLAERAKTSGRSDDTEETIQKRIQLYREQSVQCAAFYNKLAMLRSVSTDGKSPDEVYSEVRKHFLPKIALVAGPPGAGKGTQCAKIATEFGYEHLSAGDLLRVEVARGSADGVEIERLVRNGQLVPDELTLSVIKRAIAKSGSTKFTLDGFPRNLKQAALLEKEVGPVEFALHIDVPEGECKSRLSNRAGGAFAKRMRTFERKTRPVLDLLAQSSLLRVVNGVGSAEEVASRVRSNFAPKVVFVLGGPGAGKTSNCERLAQSLGYTHLNAGDLLRAEVARSSTEGLAIDDMIRSGKIVPVDVTLQLLRKAMTASNNDKFVIDGFPRALDQAIAFEQAICECSFVLYLTASNETLLSRAPEQERKIQTFGEQTLPVINFYAQRGRVRTVSAEGSADDVYAAVQSAFESDVVFALSSPGVDVSAYCSRLANEFGYVRLNVAALQSSLTQRNSSAAEGASSSDTNVQLLRDAMASNHRAGKFIVEGFPSTTAEAELYESKTGCGATSVLFFDGGDAMAAASASQDELEKFVMNTRPIIETYSKQGKVNPVAAESADTESVWERARCHFQPTIVLCAAKQFEQSPRVFMNICRATGCSRIQAQDLLLREAESGSTDGLAIQDAYENQRMVPIDITLRLIKAEILASRAQKVLLEGFPRLESAGIPGVPDQVAALEREIAQPVHLLHLDNSKYESEGHADATRFRLETLPVIRYFEKLGNCTALDMANPDETKIEGGSTRLAAAVSVLNQQFDPEARARLTAQKLAKLEEEERLRREAAAKAAEDDLGGGDEEEENEDE